MTSIIAYLHFNGNCREAMTFYQACLGGTLVLQTVGESAMASQTPPETHQDIMHSMLSSGGIALMASDMGKGQFVHGNSISLMISCDTEEEINSYFARLAEGGTVQFPLAVQFWGSIYGELTDKFGLTWTMNCDQPKA
jgi:PhnB protein